MNSVGEGKPWCLTWALCTESPPGEFIVRVKLQGLGHGSVCYQVTLKVGGKQTEMQILAQLADNAPNSWLFQGLRGKPS